MTETSKLDEDELEIVPALEEDIIFGRLRPGARLTEDALLARFPVTRHLVRQALFKLESKGILVRKRNRGAMVRLLSPAEVKQIYAVRELLQRQAALWMPLPAPPELIDRLTAIHEEYCRDLEAGYLRGVHEANDRFHLTLFGACGNRYLVQTIEQYMHYSLAVRAKSMGSPETLSVSRDQHRPIIEVLKGTDNWVLAQLCVDHQQPSKLSYLRAVTEGRAATPDARPSTECPVSPERSNSDGYRLAHRTNHAFC
jgi:DNA-binding GntR family transcriptional regulator